MQDKDNGRKYVNPSFPRFVHGADYNPEQWKETKEIWAQTVEDYEKSLADIDHSYWMVAPDAIAAYQSRIPYLRVQTDDLGTAMYVSQSEGSSYYQLVDNIANDQATVEELLTAIDKKVQMMRLEGN